MALIKKFTREDYSTYEYHRIVKIGLPTFVRHESTEIVDGPIGWGEGLVTVESFISKAAAQAGAQPAKTSQHVIPYTALPTIQWGSQSALLSWAYTELKQYLGELSDATDDMEVDAGPADSAGSST